MNRRLQRAVPAALGVAQAPRRRLASCCALILFLGSSVILCAQERVVIADFSLGVDAKGVPQTWQLCENFGHASFSLVKLDGLDAGVLRSADTSFSLQKRVNVELEQYPILSWKWKVTKLPTGGDFRNARTDDQGGPAFSRIQQDQGNRLRLGNDCP